MDEKKKVKIKIKIRIRIRGCAKIENEANRMMFADELATLNWTKLYCTEAYTRLQLSYFVRNIFLLIFRKF